MSAQKNIAGLIGRPVVWAIGVVLIALGAWWLNASLAGGKSAKVQARLNGNVASAAIESGADAVNAVGSQMASEAAADTLTQENEREIRNAPGADAPVDPRAAAAALASLCKRAAYRERPECLQPPAAR